MNDFHYTPVPAPQDDPALDPEAVWVFGYGSLMWRPGFEPAEIAAATLSGFHRDLCLISIHYRGTRDNPGLVCGLCDGGDCTGRALRIAPDDVPRVMKYLDDRELITKIYIPRHYHVTLADGRKIAARVYVADRTHEQYVGHWPDDRKVEHIVRAAGSEGRSFEYLENIVLHLRELGIHDTKMERLYTAALAHAKA
ncbi:MAG: gamma-glutamylcyclotransferase [Rhodobacteraceae bacterium]|nr:gamma-glutamylcyclotransferase [Paracoccaceae bacterium]